MPSRMVHVSSLSENISGTFFSDVSLLGLALKADLLVQIVMLLLLFASLFSWAIIFNKLFLMRRLKREFHAFQKLFYSGTPFEKIAEEYKARRTSPNAFVELFMVGINEWRLGNPVQKEEEKEKTTNCTLARIEKMMSVHLNRFIEQIGSHLSLLASIGSNAVFIGLFGTVWGIMTSFQSVALSQNTSLAIVAPGIAEALLATAMGLVVAIPAVIFYNKFVADIAHYHRLMDAFIDEITAILARPLKKE